MCGGRGGDAPRLVHEDALAAGLLHPLALVCAVGLMILRHAQGFARAVADHGTRVADPADENGVAEDQRWRETQKMSNARRTHFALTTRI